MVLLMSSAIVGAFSFCTSVIVTVSAKAHESEINVSAAIILSLAMKPSLTTPNIGILAGQLQFFRSKRVRYSHFTEFMILFMA